MPKVIDNAPDGSTRTVWCGALSCATCHVFVRSP